MGRIRTVKPEFFASESMGLLSLAAERSFIGLWTQCDDWGRARDNAKVLNGALWPMRVEHTWELMEADLVELEAAGKVCRYEVDGRRYLHIPTWRRHQVTKSAKPLHPGCPEHNPPKRGEATQGAFDLSEDGEVHGEPDVAVHEPVEAPEAPSGGRERPAAGARRRGGASPVAKALTPWWSENEAQCRQSFAVVKRIMESVVAKGMPVDDAMRALDVVVKAGKPVASGTLIYAVQQQGGESQDSVAKQSAARDPGSFTHEL